jgi:hypothetical protein
MYIFPVQLLVRGLIYIHMETEGRALRALIVYLFLCRRSPQVRSTYHTVADMLKSRLKSQEFGFPLTGAELAAGIIQAGSVVISYANLTGGTAALLFCAHVWEDPLEKKKMIRSSRWNSHPSYAPFDNCN